MTTTLPIPINPSVLTWARMESGYPVDRVADRLHVTPGRVAEWEQGTRPPTLRQLEELARFFHRPLSVFFQTTLPQVPALAAEFRRLPGIAPGQESPELRLALRKMSGRRDITANLLEELGSPATPFGLSAHLTEDPAAVAARLRAELKIGIAEQVAWPNEWRAWAAWRGAIEALGVLVFQFSKVPLEESRGVSLLRFPIPVAAVNSREAPESRSFTLMHEVVHLMLASANEEKPAQRETRGDAEWGDVERFAEEVASHTLVPESALALVVRENHLPRNNWDVGDVRSLARKFRITPLAMATRLRASGYLTWPQYHAWKETWSAYVATLAPRSPGFAHPVAQTLGRAGRPFVRLVLEALAANRITPVNASRYLDLKFEHFEKLKGALQDRPGSGGNDE